MIRLHDAPHTAATILLDSGAAVSAVAKWLGHDPAVLLRIYGHVYPEALEAANAALTATRPKRLEPSSPTRWQVLGKISLLGGCHVGDGVDGNRQ